MLMNVSFVLAVPYLNKLCIPEVVHKRWPRWTFASIHERVCWRVSFITDWFIVLGVADRTVGLEGGGVTQNGWWCDGSSRETIKHHDGFFFLFFCSRGFVHLTLVCTWGGAIQLLHLPLDLVGSFQGRELNPPESSLKLFYFVLLWGARMILF